MKYCPACQTRYDEEILRFCTKDGTPLIDENKPVFSELPSESVQDDFDEETVIRRNPPAVSEPAKAQNPTDRIVIPTKEVSTEQQVRPKTSAAYQRPLPPPNNTKLVITTILGTLIILGSIVGIFWVFSNQNAADGNQNVNVNTNFNSLDTNQISNFNIDNTPLDYNLNSNYNSNLDSNFNSDFNSDPRTPTPTPTRTPTPTPTPLSNSNLNTNNVNIATPTPASNINAKTPTPIPASPPPTPKPTPAETPANRPVNAGVLNGRAINLPKPAYPSSAKQLNATGQVMVQVAVDEFGNITSAKATTGHPLLRAPAEAAARQSKINPVKVSNQPVQATGILLYNFINQ